MKKYKVIACEILFRELSLCAARGDCYLDITFMPKLLHDIGQEKMQARLQEELDQVDREKYEAIVLCYGLCNNGIIGLTAPLPMIIPRAHDCITLLLGSKEGYRTFFDENPGTFFHSCGWIERDTGGKEGGTQLTPHKTLEEYAEEYGEENAQYLYDMCESWVQNYSKLTYIDMGVGPDDRYKEFSQNHAAAQGWTYLETPGSLRLLEAIAGGTWNDRDFLTVPVGQTLTPSYRDDIIALQKSPVN